MVQGGNARRLDSIARNRLAKAQTLFPCFTEQHERETAM
jgi:hypothetical protein